VIQPQANTTLSKRGLRPVADLAKDRPHGDRLKYLAGCRCSDCRRANTDHEKARAIASKNGDWNGIVSAEKARAHLAELSKAGVGRRVVGDVTGVADSVLTEVIAGRKTNIRARTERLILGVTVAAAADHALVPAADTWKLIDELLADGHSKAELARLLGYKMPALQLRRSQVTVRNAYDVKQLHERLRTVDAKRPLRLLDSLAAEGYTRRMILDGLAKLAAKFGKEPPVLTVRDGRIRADAAQVVEQLHAQWVEA
jgi:hypothetical protein